MDIKIDRRIRDGTFQMRKEHYHPYYEFFYMKSGKCKFFINHTIYHVEAGDMILLPPLTLHQSTYIPGVISERIAVFMGEHYLAGCDRQEMKAVNQVFQTVKIRIQEAHREAAEGLLERVSEELSDRDEYSSMLVRGYLQELIVLCGRHRMGRPEPGKIRMDENELAIQNAAEYMYHHYYEAITLNRMAELAAMSPAYFSRKFKAVTGLGYKEYLNHLRLKEATRQLLETGRSITEIALACGYCDSNYFGDVFYKVNGISPREYRRNRSLPKYGQ